jgi:hypothetical protein
VDWRVARMAPQIWVTILQSFAIVALCAVDDIGEQNNTVSLFTIMEDYPCIWCNSNPGEMFDVAFAIDQSV